MAAILLLAGKPVDGAQHTVVHQAGDLQGNQQKRLSLFVSQEMTRIFQSMGKKQVKK